MAITPTSTTRTLLVTQVAGQASAVAAGTFHADSTDLAVPTKPPQQLPVAVTVGRELPVAEQPSLGIEHGSVVVRLWVSTPPMTTPRALGHS